MRITTSYKAAGIMCKTGYAKRFSDLRLYIAPSRLARDVKISYARADNLLNNNVGHLTREEYGRVARMLKVKVQDVLHISIKVIMQQTTKKNRATHKAKK